MKKKPMQKSLKFVLPIFAVLLIAGVCLGGAVYKGKIILNHPSKKQYPVRGVDVSAYQGDIDWNVLEKQEIHFAFLKATEGSSFADCKFAENYKEAIETGLRIGAYHS